MPSLGVDFPSQSQPHKILHGDRDVERESRTPPYTVCIFCKPKSLQLIQHQLQAEQSFMIQVPAGIQIVCLCCRRTSKRNMSETRPKLIKKKPHITGEISWILQSEISLITRIVGSLRVWFSPMRSALLLATSPRTKMSFIQDCILKRRHSQRYKPVLGSARKWLSYRYRANHQSVQILAASPTRSCSFNKP